MSEKLIIPFCQPKKDIKEVSDFLDTLEKNKLNHALWNYKFDGEVNFSICYNDDAIYLKFFVKEKDVIAKYTQTNDPVYLDSCVEFFISFEGDTNYYNFEFNSLGTCLAQYGGTFKPDRKVLSVERLQEIKTLSKSSKTDDWTNWELTISLPKSVFVQPIDFSNKKARVNFYKCGDDLPQPHFLSWNFIDLAEPNFHVPEFFGEAIFRG